MLSLRKAALSASANSLKRGRVSATSTSSASSFARRSSVHTASILSSHYDEHKQMLWPVLVLSASCAALAAASWDCSLFDADQRKVTLMEEAAPVEQEKEEEEDKTTTLLNWSGTHSVTVSNDSFYEPETVEEVEAIVADCYEHGKAIRPLGSALSPNAVAFSNAGMMSLANLDRIVKVDTENKTVTVQAGARVSQVIEALRPYNLTLPNLASIAEQQMGGFVQVGAHGTGKAIAPVDHYVTCLKVVTPSKYGTMTLTKEKDGMLFDLAKVGLGCLGIVVEITMECIPAHRLVEHTFVLTRDEAKSQVNDLLNKHKHMRYMWIPYTDAVVVVTNDPEGGDVSVPFMWRPSMTEEERFQPLRDLLVELTKDTETPMTREMMQGMGFGELRDALVAANPLDVDHIKRCNEAEAEFWRRSEGYQVKPSDELLQFDCGGQQWVKEICFPTGTQEANNGNDMEFMVRLMEGIENEGIPAHSPIEQRWTASSSSLMSPASLQYSSPDGLHSWVGIISYLPADDDDNKATQRQRDAITKLFTGRYCDLMQNVGRSMHATSHWAKLEQPLTTWQMVDLRLFLQHRFPIQLFNQVRGILDPKNLLGNDLLNTAFGKPTPPSSPTTTRRSRYDPATLS